MRNISFALTTSQFLDGSKTVTRRIGWAWLKKGARLMAVKKSMGLKKGEKIEQLGALEVVNVYRVPLSEISPVDVRREGFPGVSPEDFVLMFCKHMKCDPSTVVTRIEFRRVVADVVRS